MPGNRAQNLFPVRYFYSLLLLFPLAGYSQDRPRQDINRPTIGVALEGGGAKGLAHIGVLQWMEEHHIPIDYVAGTSMGGLVGGLYSTGLRAAEIRQIVKGINWNEVLAGQIPYSAMSFRRKEDLRAFPNRLELGLRGGVSMPGGLTSGQAVRGLLDRYMLPYSEPKSFDELPIPFRCVATDLVTGKAEVFSKGSVSSALRATMSLPGVFAPVREKGKVYADGGLLNNLPTDVVKQMGADVVIGLHLSVGPTDPKDLQTLLQIAGVASGVMIDANVLRGMELADLVVTIDVAGYTTLDFSRVEQIISQGYRAAEAKANLLNRFRLDDDDWTRHLARRDSRRLAPAPVVDFVEVEGIDKDLGAVVSERLEHHTGAKVDTAALESDLRRIVGIGRFDSLSYGLTKRHDKTGLLITAEEKNYSPPWLKPGFEIDGSDPDNVGFTVAGRMTFLDVGGYRSEWRTDFAAGSRYGIRTEYYRPFSPLSRWFLAPRTGIARTPLNLYARSKLLAEYRLNTFFAGVDAGFNFDRYSELRFGYEAGYADATLRAGSPSIPSGGGRTGSTRLRFAMDRLDNPIIPRSGVALISNTEWVDANVGGDGAFPSADTTIAAFARVSSPGSVYGTAAGGTTFGNRQVGLPQFSLGGPMRLSAYGLNEFLVNQYFYGSLGYLHQVGELPAFLGGNVYLTTFFELARPYGPQNTSGLHGDGAVALATETLLGPLMVGGSIGGSGHRKWFFRLGRIF